MHLARNHWRIQRDPMTSYDQIGTFETSFKTNAKNDVIWRCKAYDLTQFRTQYNITQIRIYKVASVGASLSPPKLTHRDSRTTQGLFTPTFSYCDIDFEQMPFHWINRKDTAAELDVYNSCTFVICEIAIALIFVIIVIAGVNRPLHCHIHT